jgi:DNA polymerase-3 subunit alpha
MPPDINESFGTFTVVTPGTKDNKAADPNIKLDTIRFGLKAIKNVGEHIVDELIKIRKQDGPYQDIFDLLKRVTDKDLNKKSLESLIKGGALESFGERGLLLANLEKFLSFNKEEAKQKDSRQDSLFAELGSEAISLPTLNPAPPAEKNEMLAWEKELLGLYVSEHPFNLFKRYLTNYALPLAHLGAHKNDDSIITAGVITNIKKIITRKGDSMIFVKIEDAISSVELLIFPRLYKETNDFWLEGRAVIVTGKISEKDQDLKILVDQVALLDLASPEKSIDDFKKKITANASNLRQKFVNGFKRNLGFKKTPAQSAPTSSVPTSPVSTSSVPTSSASALPESPQIPTEPEINNQGSKPLLLSFIKDLSANELTELRSLFAQNSGRDNVYFKIIEGGKYKVIKTAFLVENNQQLQQDLQKKFAKSIKITS